MDGVFVRGIAGNLAIGKTVKYDKDNNATYVDNPILEV